MFVDAKTKQGHPPLGGHVYSRGEARSPSIMDAKANEAPRSGASLKAEPEGQHGPSEARASLQVV